MKDIKFRAFQDNKMLIQVNSGVYATKKFLDKLYEDCKLMQFTGLKDKNGKEIYQGDILKWTSWSLGSGRKANKISEVIWNAGAWRLSGNETWVLAIYTNIEVIGNIYENPDLINN